ncbi:MAG: hypothetical protein ABR529_15740 [Actinomycetota bacterium]
MPESTCSTAESGNKEADASFIATFDPPTVLKLLAVAEAAEKAESEMRDGTPSGRHAAVGHLHDRLVDLRSHLETRGLRGAWDNHELRTRLPV